MIKALLVLSSLMIYQKDIDKLGDPRFVVRDKAHQKLEKSSWLAIWAMQLNQPTPEGNRRCRLLIESKQVLDVEEYPPVRYLYGRLAIVQSETDESSRFKTDYPEFATNYIQYYGLSGVAVQQSTDVAERHVTRIIANKVMVKYNVPRYFIRQYFGYMEYSAKVTQEELVDKELKAKLMEEKKDKTDPFDGLRAFFKRGMRFRE